MTCGCGSSGSSDDVDMTKYKTFGPLKFYECGCGCEGAVSRNKFVISFLSALIFYIVAHPQTFQAMRAVLGGWVSSTSGCPTTLGLFLHSLVFFLVVWGLMHIKKSNN